MKKIISRTLKSKNLPWILGGISVLFFFGLYLYSDICHSSVKGVVFWETMFQGRMDEFYSYFYPAVENSYFPDGLEGGSYDFLFYIIFAIWDFPLWCFEKITGVSFLSTYVTRLYAKGIVLFFAIISGCLVKKIIESIDAGKGKRGLFYFLFSPLLLCVTVVIGGYDIIAVFFTLLGIWFYMEEREIPFIISFAIASVCKMFALLVFVPLVLIKQKNVLKVIAQMLGGTSIIIASKVITIIGGINRISETSMLAHANLINFKMFSKAFSFIQMGKVPLFFALTFIFWWMCWKKKAATKIEIIYIALISMSIFVVFVDIQPYWIVLLVPYVAIIMAINTANIVNNFILEMIFSIGFLVYIIGLYPWVFGLRLVNKMFGVAEGNFFKYEICGVNLMVKYISEFSGILMDNVYSLFACCFVIGLGLFLYENRPKVLQSASQEKVEINWCLDWIRVGVGIGVMLIPFTEVLRLLTGALRSL